MVVVGFRLKETSDLLLGADDERKRRRRKMSEMAWMIRAEEQVDWKDTGKIRSLLLLMSWWLMRWTDIECV